MSRLLLKIGGIFALFGIGASLYFAWELYSFKQNLESQQEIIVALSIAKETLGQKNEEFSQKIAQLVDEKTGLQKAIDLLENSAYQEARSKYTLLFLPTHPSSGEAAGKSVKLLEPNGGETLCVGTSYSIRWESSGIQEVAINITKIYEDGSTTSMGIGHSPANLGGYVWQIKEDMFSRLGEPSGDGYEIQLITLSDGSIVEDKSDASFAIRKCN